MWTERSSQWTKSKALADLPGKEVLLSMLLSAMQGPVRGLATVLDANISGLAAFFSPWPIRRPADSFSRSPCLRRIFVPPQS